ncbi:peptide deformylase [Leclercia adecarboxylata]|uniref:Peptide deformylase n=1 Tax=Leclercia adecarboxylata TaxID=83655 RepID=A0AAP9DE92_9ENTR|nr:peptide deformylase [Leclercia adecarboxylata]
MALRLPGLQGAGFLPGGAALTRPTRCWILAGWRFAYPAYKERGP